MMILGINDVHNTAACLYEDGQVVAAIQEERLRHAKNWAGMPVQAVNEIRRIAGDSIADIDFVPMNGGQGGSGLRVFP